MPPPPLTEQFWDARHPPANPTHLSFKGLTVLVTGANTGMGFQAALKYAQLGASTLVMAVQTAAKGEAAKAEIVSRLPKPVSITIIIKTVDLSSLSSVKTFADEVNATMPELHVAQFCAGVMMPSFTVGTEGFETAFQINVLSTALMAILLPNKVQQAASLSSCNGYTPHITFFNSVATQDILGEWIPECQTLVERINDRSRLDHVSQYYLVKLTARYFVEGLAIQCRRDNIIVNCSCPAMCRGTNLHRDYPCRSIVGAAGLGRESNGKLWLNDELRNYAGFMATERSARLGQQTYEEIVEILREKAGLEGYP
ncbi:short-chain dehydrogenase/reductase [Xylariaceae sp. FL1272]|nr:short-chain dehydrogenase/reductase [Xylariaceae sp. FL1272]